MMIYPPIADLVKRAGSRYTLVIEAARRARQLSQGEEPLVDIKATKEVTVAANEIFEDKICAVSTECDADSVNTDVKDDEVVTTLTGLSDVDDDYIEENEDNEDNENESEEE